MALSQLDLDLMEYSDKTLKMWCLLSFKDEEMNKQYWIVYIYKYVRQWSSSSEWYDWVKLKKWEMCCSNHRSGELYFIVLWYRKSMYWKPDWEWEFISDSLIEKYFNIHGSPFWWGRVCMLNLENRKNWPQDLFRKYDNMECYFNKNPELYDMDCLSWDDETKKLVLDFLISLWINGNTVGNITSDENHDV